MCIAIANKEIGVSAEYSNPSPVSENQEIVRPKQVFFLTLLREIGPWAYAISIAVFYVAGFLVLSSSLYLRGVYDYEYANTQYLLAAANYLFFVFCFYFFSGRSIFFVKRRLNEDFAKINSEKIRPFYSFAVVVHSYVSMPFLLCVSSAIYTSIAISTIETQSFSEALFVAFALTYAIDHSPLHRKLPLVSEIVQIAIEVYAIKVFFSNLEFGYLMVVTLVYLFYALYVNLVMDKFERYKSTTEQICSQGVYTVFFFLIGATVFGSLIFSNISHRMGGTKRQSIILTLSADSLSSLPHNATMIDNGKISTELIYQNDKYTYVNISNSTTRLRTSDVISMTVPPNSSAVAWDTLIKSMRKK